MVQREDDLQIERASPGIAVGTERAERLASLLTLSYEPVFAWRLDGPIQIPECGAEQPYGFSQDEASAAPATHS